MGSFREGNRGFGGRGGSGRSGGRSFGGGRGGGSRGGFGGRGGFSRGPTEMHDAVCSKCKSDCQVPFRPTGSRPVLCSNCFEKSGDSRSSRGSRDSGDSRNRFDSRNEIRPVQRPMNDNQSNEIKQINAKLDKIIEILQQLELDTGDEDGEDELVEDLDETPEDIVEGKTEKDFSEDSEDADEDDDAELSDDEELA